MYSLTIQQHPYGIKQGKSPTLVPLKAGPWDRSLSTPGLQTTRLLWGGIEQEAAAAAAPRVIGAFCDITFTNHKLCM